MISYGLNRQNSLVNLFSSIQEQWSILLEYHWLKVE